MVSIWLLSASILFSTGASAAAVTGGPATKAAYAAWRAEWRKTYQVNDGQVPDLEDGDVPKALQGIKAKVVISSGGAAGGVVTEGMGYAILVEGFEAVAGNKDGLDNCLALTKAWLGMVYGPDRITSRPLGGGVEAPDSSTKVDTWPYGVSAVKGASPAGVAAWKYPLKSCSGDCLGSATDGDEDALMGMIYLAAALEYPADFVDMVMRMLISFASADLGFPDLYRSLNDGTRVFIPKGGSQWGGLLPHSGKFNSTQGAGCYNPSYFAPGHYRLFRDFAEQHWKDAFDLYLPQFLNGTKSALSHLRDAFNGAVVGGYNMLYHSSCSSGAVANWVGAQAKCSSSEQLNCAGVPWANTPFVGESGKCSASGTTWGQYGPDASRTPWRIAMDYVLYEHESEHTSMYGTTGDINASLEFGAKAYLNRFVEQYKKYAQCDGGKAGDCMQMGQVASYKIAPAFSGSTPGLTCHNVPNAPQDWWAAFMSFPTFATFVAPSASVSATECRMWMDTLASICNFSAGKPTGNPCSTSYFDAGQEVISTMIMSGAMVPLPNSSLRLVV